MKLIRTSRNGFALIVVLSTLSIIALLFAIASSRAINRLGEVRTDVLIADHAHEVASLLELAAQVFGSQEGRLNRDQALAVRWQGQPAELRLQDVGGLIDLNTANPALLEQFAQALDVSSAQIAQYREWRRRSLRLLRTEDFLRVIAYDEVPPVWFRQVTTVYSGRPGISEDHAPPKLLEILTEGRGPLLPEWVSQPSGSNYQVVLTSNSGATRVLGSISFALAEQSKLLEYSFP